MRYKIIDEIGGKIYEHGDYLSFLCGLNALLCGLPKLVESVDEEGYVHVYRVSLA